MDARPNMNPPAASQPAAADAEEISQYFLHLDWMLQRVERAESHYQCLGVDRLATHAQVKLAFEKAVELLFPPYEIGASLPPPMLERMQEAFEKVSRAFATLSRWQSRGEYDAGLSQTAPAAPHKAAPPAAAGPAQESVARIAEPRGVYTPFAKSIAADNRRRANRFKLRLPARVSGFDRKTGKWDEMSETIDVSRTGATFHLSRRLALGTIVHVTMPMPTKLRNHGFGDHSYNVYALVRRVDPPRGGKRVVGVEFVGERPPSGLLEKPWITFRSRRWSGGERRRSPRVRHVEVVTIEYFTEEMESIALERARTEDVSPYGTRVSVRIAPPSFDFVRVACPARGFEALAVLADRFTGKDGVERLSLRFLNQEWRL